MYNIKYLQEARQFNLIFIADRSTLLLYNNKSQQILNVWFVMLQALTTLRARRRTNILISLAEKTLHVSQASLCPLSGPIPRMLLTCEASLSLFPQQQGRHPVTSLVVGLGGKLSDCRLLTLLFPPIPTPLNGRSMSTNSRSCNTI